MDYQSYWGAVFEHLCLFTFL